LAEIHFKIGKVDNRSYIHPLLDSTILNLLLLLLFPLCCDGSELGMRIGAVSYLVIMRSLTIGRIKIKIINLNWWVLNMNNRG